MKDLSPFCTCTDLDCPLHPTRHEKGCAPCIAKNLRQNEIPSCFFNKLGREKKTSAYSFEDFATEVFEREKDKEKPQV